MGVDWSLREGYAWAEDKEHCEEYGRMLQADPNKVSSKAKKRGLPQVIEQPNTIGGSPGLVVKEKCLSSLIVFCSWEHSALATTMLRSRWWTRSTTTMRPRRWASTTRARCA